jgi:hypothetical protein
MHLLVKGNFDIKIKILHLNAIIKLSYMTKPTTAFILSLYINQPFHSVNVSKNIST